MTKKDFKLCRKYIESKTTRRYYPTTKGEIQRALPTKERWSARYFDYDTVFHEVLEHQSVKQELDWFYDFSKWEEYRNYYSSGHMIQTPPKKLTETHQHGRLFQ